MEDIKVIREEFKKYLYKQVADNKLSKVDADTQYSDADYIRKHEDDLLISYYSIFISNERFEQALLNLKKQFQNQGKSDSTFYAYKRALNSYKMFFEEYIKDQLKVYLAKYFTYKSSPNYDEQYKYDYFAKNSYIFDDLNDLSEKFIQLGSPNFVPYVWKSSMFRHLAFKHSFQFSQILENLFNETLSINTRIKDFRKDIREILLKDSEWNNKDMIDPSVEAASFFLSLKYPNKYLLFTRIKPYTNFSKDFYLGLEKFNNEDRYIAWIDYCKNNLIPLLNNYCNSNCNLLDCQDFIWFVFNQNKGDNMSLKEKFIKYVYDIVYKSNQSYLQYGKKIENLDNVILNLTNKQIYEIQNSEELSSFLFQLKKISEWQDYNHKNGNGIPYAILNTHYRKFIQNNIVKDNSMKQEANFAQEKIYQPLNQILYGPPGTGKTYNSVLKAMSIIDNTEYKDVSEEQYSALKTRFDELKQAGQIEFVTFHQSYSYEEFVEGIKPYIPEWGTTDNTEVRYIGENGIFKRICKKAESPIIKSNDNNLELNDNPKIWKVSLMKTGENDIRKDCMENNRIRIGFDKYGETINDETIFDDGGSRVLSAFIDKMEIGDIVLSCYSEKTIDAIGVVTSEYKWNNDFPQYKRYREVKWLAKGLNHNILKINNGTKFTLGTVYQLNNMSLKDVLDIVDEQEQVTSYKDNDKLYILIIDEINRGDVSKIFGELITLIEEDKRVGNKYQMKTTLPYSKESFGVPNNLYIIGTMNTADRSIALLDTALRRRFDFEEIMPRPELLGGKVVEGINLQTLLTRVNERITNKYDRDHQIGHSYLMGVNTKEQLERAYKNRILPLLNEYFYNESKTVAEILNCSEDELKTIDFISILGKAQGA
ncbi:gTPase subunit of restriction endonuclease [Fusobacterium sp. CAG:439]|nr:gTPase subunit of restriction endonuclease [Fusobacterium sp. CAG:439]